MKSETKKRPRFLVTHKDESIVALVKTTGHKTLAVWAIDCVERVFPFFEDKYPEDDRPRKAIDAIREWIRSGIFKMADVRKFALDAHAAARQVGADNAARSATRAAGQAMATAHVPTHSIGAANYALQAIYRATISSNVETSITKERDWQYQHLLRLKKAEFINPTT